MVGNTTIKVKSHPWSCCCTENRHGCDLAIGTSSPGETQNVYLLHLPSHGHCHLFALLVAQELGLCCY